MKLSRPSGNPFPLCALVIAAWVTGCGSSASGRAGASDSGSDSDAANVALQWWATCPDPACSSHRDAGIPACTTEAAHAPCSQLGAQCDPGDRCNSHLVCSDQDPTPSVGCPISPLSEKTDIRFLSSADLATYRDQVLALPLATFRYREGGPGSRLHLGFMIDGHESLVCVDPGRDRVDLYGYASMAVAALQVQAREIEQLRKQVAALQARVEASRPKRRTGLADR